MIQFYISGQCYVQGGMSTNIEIFNQSVCAPKLTQEDLDDCGVWQAIILFDSNDRIMVDYEDVDTINAFTGNNIQDLEVFLKTNKVLFERLTKWNI